MELLIVVVGLSPWLLNGLCDNISNTTSFANSSYSDKDMYIINAMVYQVGILTNKTNKGSVNTTGNQESVTFYHTNGTKVDLSAIPEPLLTNVTAQSIVGLAPASKVSGHLEKSSAWSTLNNLASIQQPVSLVAPDNIENFKSFTDNQNSMQSDTKSIRSSNIPKELQLMTTYKRSLDGLAKTLFRRDLTSNTKTPVKIVNGAVVIPPAASVQSIAIPPLLALNNNLSNIPVPIPNTAIVHYAKINTLCQVYVDNKQRKKKPITAKLRPKGMSSPKLNERCPSNMSNGKKILNNDSKEDSLDNSIRESTKSERPGGGKSEEDWRRRTIIVEKKNGSYGFTLQSYGIHYKKEQEIEVITYVDHVEIEGPAAAAGMREGDVILSINGADVERAEHASIVDAINRCDSRMRMVVIFEDCVRKVELHLKYINIQRDLQSKMRELEQLTVRERQLFDSNWKTHSLPSQKKKTSPSDVTSDTEDNNVGENINNTYCRPTLSSENVTAAKPPQANVFMYQYLDPRYGTCFIQPNIRTGSFVITVGSPRNRRDCHHYIVKPPNECHRASETYKSTNVKHSKSHRNNHSHSCAPCMPAYNNQDANSLEAYDLASPCCDPHCVPNTRKKIRRRKECSKEHKRKEKFQQVDKSTQKPDSGSHSRTKKMCPSGQCSSRYRYLTTESTQTSQCSLQSYATSNATVACDNSTSSYSTSLSSDTLFWDNDRPETKSSPKIQYQSSHQHVKPKSWDNLTTKAIGGYGFGYGYLDTSTKHSSRSKSHGRTSSCRSTQSHHDYQHHSQEKHPHRQNPALNHYSGYTRSHSHCAPTKSTESLIVVPKYQLESSGSESRLACDCTESIEYYRRVSSTKSPGEAHSTAYYTQHFIYPTHAYKKKDPNVSSEITRL